MFLRLLPILLILPGALRAADSPWRYVDPSAKLLMGVQYRHILDSPIGQRMGSHNPFLAIFPLGSLATGVDSILIASQGRPPAKDATPPMLMILSGQFDLPRVRASISRNSRRAVVQNIEIFESGDRASGRMAIALVSADTLLVGDMASVVRGVGAVPARDGWQLARARQLAAQSDLWMLLQAPAAELGGSSLLPLPALFNEAQGAELSATFDDTLTLDLSLRTDSPDTAEDLREQFLKSPELAPLDQYAELIADREYVKLSLEMDGAAIDHQLRASQAAQRRAEAAPKAPPPPTPTTKPEIRKPVIWNADPN